MNVLYDGFGRLSWDVLMREETLRRQLQHSVVLALVRQNSVLFPNLRDHAGIHSHRRERDIANFRVCHNQNPRILTSFHLLGQFSLIE